MTSKARSIKFLLLAGPKIGNDDKRRLITEFNEAVKQERANRTPDDKKRVEAELAKYEKFKEGKEGYDFIWEIPESFSYVDIEEFYNIVRKWPYRILSRTQKNLNKMDFCAPPPCGGVRGREPTTILSQVAMMEEGTSRGEIRYFVTY